MNKTGVVGWFDLTIDDAENVKAFYESVVGWESSGTDMGGYYDYCMSPPGSSEPVAGICHRRGPNESIPPQWLIYVNVEDLDASIKKCEELGGKIVSGPRDMGSFGRMCVIEDPAGAVCAIIQPNS
jgi:predicted enzyme related to lactoylglutathione lyase